MAAPEYGDLVVVVDAAGNPVHVCNYIAADFVYTKNSANTGISWAFMKVVEMVRLS